MRGWIVLAALVGCGDNDAEVEYRDGSRLALHWLVADDGTRVPTNSIHDRMRDDDCYMQVWGDGVTRCTTENGFVVYSDAACTQPVVIDAQVALDAIATQYDPAGCGISRAFKIGAATSGTTWYFPTATTCAGPYTSSNPIYALGAQIDPGMFEKVDIVGPDSGPRLASKSYAAADGLRLPWQVYDNALATTCSPNAGACQPSNTTDVRYIDAACTQRVVVTYDSPCSQDAEYFADSDPTCPNHQHYYRLAKAVTPAQIYLLDSSTMACTADTISGGMHFSPVGAEVSPAEMTRASSLPEGKRLQALYDAGDGVAVRSGRYYDGQLQIECVFQGATDGVSRCLPVANGWSPGFTDSACTNPVLVTFASHPKTGCGAPDPAPSFATGYSGSGTVVRLVTGPFHGGLYANNGAGCKSLSYPDGDPYLVGDLVDPKSFVGSTMESP